MQLISISEATDRGALQWCAVRVALCLVFLLALPLQAEPLQGEAELGLVSISGNSDARSLNAKLDISRGAGQWQQQVKFSLLHHVSSGRTTAEKYTAELQFDRGMDERQSLYWVASYEDDRFSGFAYQATSGLGYGYQWLNSEHQELKVEIGAGYRVNAPLSADKLHNITLRVAERYRRDLSETAELKQYLSVENGGGNTIVKWGVSLRSSLVGALALKMGVDVKYSTEVPPGIDRSDTESYATLSYRF